MSSNAPLLMSKNHPNATTEPSQLGRSDSNGGESVTLSPHNDASDNQDFFESNLKTLNHDRAHDIKPSPRLPRSSFDISDEWWLLEIGGWLVSFLIVIALFVSLKSYNGRALPEWPLNITLNSLISLCTTVFKGTLLIPIAGGISQLKWLLFRRTQALQEMEFYDNASRGPYGSAQFLFSSRIGYVVQTTKTYNYILIWRL